MWRLLTSISSLLVLFACTDAPEAERETRLRASALLSEESVAPGGQAFSAVSRETPIQLPADHAPHPTYRQEWWYWTLALWSDTGQELLQERPAEFGAQLVFFRRALTPSPEPKGWRSSQVYMSHFAVTHVAAVEHRSFETLSREVPGFARFQSRPFELALGATTVRSLENKFTPLVVEAQGRDAHLRVRLEQTEPEILQGADGFSAKSETAASHYYSIPRLLVSGELGWDEARIPVVGWAWLDREWSSQELPRGLIGWDWMALMLKGGSELMLYRLVREDGSKDAFNYAVYRDAAGKVRKFGSDEFNMIALREIVFDGDTFVVEWKLVIEDVGEYSVEAAIDDQYLRTSVRYWEGLVRVRDSGGGYLGDGYLEMTR